MRWEGSRGVLVGVVPRVPSQTMVDESGSSGGQWWQVAVGMVREKKKKENKEKGNRGNEGGLWQLRLIF